jgi:hypothetical protein
VVFGQVVKQYSEIWTMETSSTRLDYRIVCLCRRYILGHMPSQRLCARDSSVSATKYIPSSLALTVEYDRCHWKVQVITPAVFNVVADTFLFIYPFPIIFMANIPQSLRYSLLFIFALCGVVTGSAIVRVAFMSAENFLEKGNVYAYIIQAAQLTIGYRIGARSRAQFHCLLLHYLLSEAA